MKIIRPKAPGAKTQRDYAVEEVEALRAEEAVLQRLGKITRRYLELVYSVNATSDLNIEEMRRTESLLRTLMQQRQDAHEVTAQAKINYQVS